MYSIPKTDEMRACYMVSMGRLVYRAGVFYGIEVMPPYWKIKVEEGSGQ